MQEKVSTLLRQVQPICLNPHTVSGINTITTLEKSRNAMTFNFALFFNLSHLTSLMPSTVSLENGIREG